jgi:hypothetical protein
VDVNDLLLVVVESGEFQHSFVFGSRLRDKRECDKWFGFCNTLRLDTQHEKYAVSTVSTLTLCINSTLYLLHKKILNFITKNVMFKSM